MYVPAILPALFFFAPILVSVLLFFFFFFRSVLVLRTLQELVEFYVSIGLVWRDPVQRIFPWTKKKRKGGGRVEMQLIERATTNEDEVKQPNRHTHTQKRRDANKSEWRLRAELVS